MTRYEAKCKIYYIVNSNIFNWLLDEEMEADLTEIANCICENSFEKCPQECLRCCKLDECPNVE